jgi:hypothetical protein
MTDDESLLRSWRTIDHDPAPISLEKPMRRADKFYRTIGWRNVREYAAAAFVVVAFGKVFVDASTPMRETGALLIIAGVLYAVWQLHRRGSARRAPAAALGESCLAFARAELERQRDALATVTRWYLAPLVPGMVILVLSEPIERHRGFVVAALVLLATALFFFAIAWANHRAARRIQHEIDALDALRSA